MNSFSLTYDCLMFEPFLLKVILNFHRFNLTLFAFRATNPFWDQCLSPNFEVLRLILKLVMILI